MSRSTTQPPVYLDYNATAPLRPAVRDAVAAALDRFGNPSSVHRFGREARAKVEDARDRLAAAVKASAAEVVFTSGGTEANALALRGLKDALGCRAVLASAVEHPSVLAHVDRSGQVPVDAEGVIDLAGLDAKLAATPGPVLVAIMAVNNETGVIQPVAEVVAIARRHGAFVHCDAVQALGKMPLTMGALGIDSLAVSAHKIGALKGCGALVLRAGLEPAAQAVGGGQERRRRAGTENTIGIAAFGAALGEIDGLLADAPRIVALRDRLEKEIGVRVPEARIFGAAVARVANTTCLARPGATSESQLIALDLAGVAVSAGSACSSGKVTPSHVLLAMGVTPALAGCAIRVSLGWETTAADIDRFLAAWLALAAPAAA